MRIYDDVRCRRCKSQQRTKLTTILWRIQGVRLGSKLVEKGMLTERVKYYCIPKSLHLCRCVGLCVCVNTDNCWAGRLAVQSHCAWVALECRFRENVLTVMVDGCCALVPVKASAIISIKYKVFLKCS